MENGVAKRIADQQHLITMMQMYMIEEEMWGQFQRWIKEKEGRMKAQESSIENQIDG